MNESDLERLLEDVRAIVRRKSPHEVRAECMAQLTPAEREVAAIMDRRERGPNGEDNFVYLFDIDESGHIVTVWLSGQGCDAVLEKVGGSAPPA